MRRSEEGELGAVGLRIDHHSMERGVVTAGWGDPLSRVSRLARKFDQESGVLDALQSLRAAVINASQSSGGLPRPSIFSNTA